jgi:hypothetical protein
MMFSLNRVDPQTEQHRYAMSRLSMRSFLHADYSRVDALILMRVIRLSQPVEMALSNAGVLLKAPVTYAAPGGA